jgi:hypothetical protein
MPATRCLVAGPAAAHSPKAPSTWTQAPYCLAASHPAKRSSQAPVFTLPACRQTMVGASGPAARTRASASGSMAPLGSAGTGSTAPDPMPRSRNDRSIVAWRSSPATTRIRGAPMSPRSSTSQPACARTR